MSSRIQRRQAQNRQALVGAARRVFVRDGFERATIATITEEADLGFGTFYRYFPDKGAILQAVIDDVAQDIEGVLSAPDNAEDTAGVALARFSRRFTAMVRRNRDVFLLMWQAGMRESRTAPNADSLPRRLGRAIEAIVRRGIDGGEFTAQHLPTTVRLLAGAHLALIAPPAWRDEDLVAGTLIDFELRALCAGSHAAST